MGLDNFSREVGSLRLSPAYVAQRNFGGVVTLGWSIGKRAALGTGRQPSCFEGAGLCAEEFIGYHLVAEAHGISWTPDAAQATIFSQAQRSREMEHVIRAIAEEGNGLGGAEFGTQATGGACLADGHVSNRQAVRDHVGLRGRR
jgi:hypothetical protein